MKIKFDIYLYTIATLIFLGITFNSCSPVRTNLSKKEAVSKDKKPKIKKTAVKNQSDSELISDKPEGLFDFENRNSNDNSNSENDIDYSGLDTNVVVYPPVRSNSATMFDLDKEFDFTPEFQKAVLEFDVNFIDKACNKFDFFASTLNPTDTLYFESLFYKSECLIAKQEYKEAEKILNRILRNEDAPSNIMQKTLVRIGHLYCVNNKPEMAEMAFEKLMNDYPKSKLIKLANCESVKITKK
ncbi:MAG: tetratricopeptide repeat protein [Candidatus Kapaibacteriota bacterium]